METSERTLIDLPKIFDIRGNLTVAEGLHHVPFNIKRVYWTYDIPAGESRGGHAHKECREFIIAVSGSFSVTLDNGHEKETFHLNHPWQGLLVETGIWRTLDWCRCIRHIPAQSVWWRFPSETIRCPPRQ